MRLTPAEILAGSPGVLLKLIAALRIERLSDNGIIASLGTGCWWNWIQTNGRNILERQRRVIP
ncbi:hypothetical protein KQI84_15395 [bacterium]|nr:hypothetical protein [bacterium]